MSYLATYTGKLSGSNSISGVSTLRTLRLLLSVMVTAMLIFCCNCGASSKVHCPEISSSFEESLRSDKFLGGHFINLVPDGSSFSAIILHRDMVQSAEPLLDSVAETAKLINFLDSEQVHFANESMNLTLGRLGHSNLTLQAIDSNNATCATKATQSFQLKNAMNILLHCIYPPMVILQLVLAFKQKKIIRELDEDFRNAQKTLDAWGKHIPKGTKVPDYTHGPNTYFVF